MATVYITGANGFIGSHLAELCLDQGHDVIGLIRPTSDLRSLQPLFTRYGEQLRLVTGDLRRARSLGAGLDHADVVYHLGAVLMGTSEREFREANVDGTRNLLEAVMASGSVGRFLFVSSQAAAGPSPTAAPIDETAAPRPLSWYGQSKRDAERLVKEADDRGLPVTIVRPVGVYGERERDISEGTFPAVQLGLSPRIGFRKKTVSMVYVGELVKGMVAAAESDVARGRTYFLGDPTTYGSTDLVNGIADAMDKTVRIPLYIPHAVLALTAVFAEWAHLFTRARPMVTRDKVREVRQRHWAASAEAAKRDFGWRASVELVDGMRRAVADWKDRVARRNAAWNEPLRDRAIKTYTLATILGLITEVLAEVGHWYEFDPPWLFWVIVAGYGVVFGTVALLTIKWHPVFQFLVGAAIFIGAEQANHFVLHWWEFAPEPFGNLPVPWGRALLLSIPIGLIPPVINWMIRVLYRRRLRLG